MSPPQLTADTPVFNVFQPVAVCILIFGRVELQLVVHYRRQCHISEMLHLEEPLHRQFRFDGYVGTFRETYLICISFYLFQQSCCIQVFFNLRTYVETIHTYIQSCSFTQCTVVIENINRRKVVFFSQHVVVHVVCRSNFQTTSTEFNVYIAVFNNRNHTSYQRNDNFLTFQPLVLRVCRVDAHSCITHDGFRTSCSYYGITATLCVAVYDFTFSSGFTAHVVISYVITQVIQFAMLFFVDYFFVRQGSQCFRVPVYHTYATVNQPLVIKFHEYLDYALATGFVHGESRTVPVA